MCELKQGAEDTQLVGRVVQELGMGCQIQADLALNSACAIYCVTLGLSFLPCEIAVITLRVMAR